MSSPLPVSAVHHISHVTRDLEASRTFYRDLLGFREIERANFNFGGAWLFNLPLTHTSRTRVENFRDA